MSHQELPTAGPEREALRDKGQFWTPAWVADAMVRYSLSGGAREILDPAVGAGAFLTATQREAAASGESVDMHGCELHAEILEEARSNGVEPDIISRIRIADFILEPPQRQFQAIVANPPYIRHHRISPEVKASLQKLAIETVGSPLDGRTGYHIFFLLRALTRLAPGGRLAFIMPADTCEGVFANQLWEWIANAFRINGVVVFDPDATPFPGVDTNAVIVLLEANQPTESLTWIRCHKEHKDKLKNALGNLDRARSSNGLTIVRRSRKEAIRTGLSRPYTPEFEAAPKLGEVARVVRGIATGANEFFFLTRAEIRKHKLPEELFVRAVGRTRDIPSDEITTEDLVGLERDGRPTFLLNIQENEATELPASVQSYIRLGLEKGLNERALIRARKAWFKMEEREPPPFLFAYLGRRNARFIKNLAGVVPLTGFLCVYPRNPAADMDCLWRVLSASATSERLASVGKSYGGGAIKVEPRALEKLPLDISVVDHFEDALEPMMDVA